MGEPHSVTFLLEIFAWVSGTSGRPIWTARFRARCERGGGVDHADRSRRKSEQSFEPRSSCV